MASEKVIILSSENFESEVLKSDKPVMIDFWAEWCGPCKMLTPIIDELAEEFSDKIKICKLNVDEVRDIAMSYRVMSIPTVIFFKGDEQIAREVGVKPKEDYISIINSL